MKHLEHLLNESHIRWMDSTEKDSDIVISSRVRLARNIQGMVFPQRMNEDQGLQVMDQLFKVRDNAGDGLLRDMQSVVFSDVSALDRQILMEKHMMSPEHAARDGSYFALMISEDGSLANMINEEDHLRIQCLLPGMQVSKAYRLAEQVDDEFEKEINYAFDERIGYLTSCPTNVGTGLRVSVMLHLPALQMTGQGTHIYQNISQLGIAVRGMYGEGSQASGNLFQLSNQVTLGQSEEEICHYLQTIAGQVVSQERAMRENVARQMPYHLADRVGRAYGILAHARVISSNEALGLLSDLRLGVDMGVLTGVERSTLNELTVAIRPAHLQKRFLKEMDALERDVKRADVVRNLLLGGRTSE